MSAPHLTDREYECLRLSAHGLTNKQIGLQLHLTEWTVKSHMKHLQRKLRARNRAHAVARAFTLRLLP